MLYPSTTSVLVRSGLRATAMAALCLFASLAWSEEKAPSGDAARDALGKQEGDVDQAALLKQTLTASDKQYSLLKKGKLAATYDLTYTYTGQQQIDAKFTDNTLTLFKIENTRSHTITNTFSVDYGLRDNLTGNVSLPIVSKYSESTTFSGLSHGP